MWNLWVTNPNKETIELTNNPSFDYVEIDFINVKATINKDKLANSDGSIFNSAYVGDRQASITLAPSYPVEENRQKIYQYFRIKKQVILRYKNNNRDVKLIGIVDGIDGSLFDLTQKIVISVECLEPYFIDYSESYTNMSQIEDMFEFPFSTEEEGIIFSQLNKTQTTNVINYGDVDTYLKIEILANGSASNPTIYNVETKEKMALKIDLINGDLITINTDVSNRGVTLTRNGITTNIINNLDRNIDWFYLKPDDNVFTYLCDVGEEMLTFKFIFSNKYEGV